MPDSQIETDKPTDYKNLTPVEMLMKKKTLSVDIDKLTKKMRSGNSVFGKSLVIIKQAKEKHICRSEVEASKNKFEGMLNALYDLKSRINSADIDTLPNFEGQISNSLAAMEAHQVNLEQLVDALKFNVREAGDKSHANYMRTRYVAMKICNKLTSYKTPEKIATFMAKLMKPKSNADDNTTIDLMLVQLPKVSLQNTLVSIESEVTSDLGKPHLIVTSDDISAQVVLFDASMMETIRERIASLSKSVKENESWNGAMLKVPLVEKAVNISKFLPVDDIVCADGRAPWLVAAKGVRYGPKAIPLPGMPTLVIGFTNISMMIVPIKPILKVGITMHNLTTFLETKDGQDIVSSHASLVNVCDGDVIYCPLGHIAMPIFAGVGTSATHGTLLYVPLLADAFFKKS